LKIDADIESTPQPDVVMNKQAVNPIDDANTAERSQEAP
jgi:hypothetical protein